MTEMTKSRMTLASIQITNLNGPPQTGGPSQVGDSRRCVLIQERPGEESKYYRLELLASIGQPFEDYTDHLDFVLDTQIEWEDVFDLDEQAELIEHHHAISDYGHSAFTVLLSVDWYPPSYDPEYSDQPDEVVVSLQGIVDTQAWTKETFKLLGE